MSVKEKTLDIQLEILHDMLEEREGKRCNCQEVDPFG